MITNKYECYSCNHQFKLTLTYSEYLLSMLILCPNCSSGNVSLLVSESSIDSEEKEDE